LQVLAPSFVTSAGLSLEGLHETETTRFEGPSGPDAGLNLGQHRAAIVALRTDRQSVAWGGVPPVKRQGATRGPAL